MFEFIDTKKRRASVFLDGAYVIGGFTLDGVRRRGGKEYMRWSRISWIIEHGLMQ